jgi:hypothetical protein
MTINKEAFKEDFYGRIKSFKEKTISLFGSDAEQKQTSRRIETNELLI